MTYINSSTTIGNILLELAEQGIMEISVGEVREYADAISKKLSTSCKCSADNCCAISTSNKDIITFAYSYEFLCKLEGDRLIFKRKNGVPVFCKMSKYFRSFAPTALTGIIKVIVTSGRVKKYGGFKCINE